MTGRINVTAQIANSTVTPRMQYAEIHPKLTSDGRFPRDFVAPKRVEDFLTMDSTAPFPSPPCIFFPYPNFPNSVILMNADAHSAD